MRAAWGADLLVRLFAVCVCVWVCVCGRMHVMHAITGCTGINRAVTTALHTAPALQRCFWARGCAVPDMWVARSLSLTLSLSRARVLSLSLALACSLALSRSHARLLSLSLSLPLSLARSLARLHARSIALSLSLYLSLILFPSALSLTLFALSLTLSLSLSPYSHAATKKHGIGLTERNMGLSLYLCFDSAGFCVGTRHGPALSSCTSMYGEGTAQITTQGHRGTLFSGRFQISGDRCTQLLRAAAPMSKSLGP